MSKLLKVLIAVVVVVVLAGAALYWFVIRSDAPAKVSTACSTTDSGSGGSTDLSGTWTVQKSSQSGDGLLKDDAPGSWAGYRIEEDLRAVHVTAVGRTPDVTGSVTVDGTKVTEATFEVDMTTLKSDEGARDGQMKSIGLQNQQFPKATFTLTDPIDLGSAGSCQEVKAVGTLNLHGQEKPVTLTLKATPDGKAFNVTGTTKITLADYDIDPPKLGFVTVDPTGDLELDLVLTK